MTTKVLLDMPEHEYHSDPCEGPALSVSVAKTLLEKSPLHAWREHPRLGGKPRAPSTTMDLGTLAHKLMLGKGAEVQVIDANDWRTKSAQTARNAARLAGRIPVLAKDAEAAPAIADSWKRNLLEWHGITIPDLTEVTLLWEYLGTQCRGRVDAIDPSNRIIYDLKRTTIAHNSRKIEGHFDSFNYAIQAAAYIQAAEANYGHVGEWRFIFIALEPDEPHCATPIEGDESFLQLGRMRWDRAVSEWATCLARDKWPPPSAIHIAARPYSLTNEAEKTYVDEI